MSDRAYTTDIDLKAGGIHLELTDAEIVAWVADHVHMPLLANLLAMMEEHGAQQVLIAVGISSSIDMWRRDHPERWAAAMKED